MITTPVASIRLFWSTQQVSNQFDVALHFWQFREKALTAAEQIPQPSRMECELGKSVVFVLRVRDDTLLGERPFRARKFSYVIPFITTTAVSRANDICPWHCFVKMYYFLIDSL